ncbi:heme exporter protein CcmD [Hyphomonas sp.]|jgi:heme exporter protein CcmD|uniref:heme exporter protein CcmD n=1 Tax=Hyphomonas sp. TaxID=87 RepID=UPI0033426765
MPEFDKNAAYIWACYGIGALLILALTLQVALAARSARKRLASLATNDTDGA